MSCHEADEHTTVPGGRETGIARTVGMRKAMNNIRENEFGSADVRAEVAFCPETGSEEIGRAEENVPRRVKTWNKWCPTDFQTWIHASRDILLYPARSEIRPKYLERGRKGVCIAMGCGASG